MVAESRLVVVDVKKGVNAVEAGEEWVDEGQVQDVQPNVEEEWQ